MTVEHYIQEDADLIAIVGVIKIVKLLKQGIIHSNLKGN
jgi:hypothetical protein